jgi:hypothetical protein
VHWRRSFKICCHSLSPKLCSTPPVRVIKCVFAVYSGFVRSRFISKNKNLRIRYRHARRGSRRTLITGCLSKKRNKSSSRRPSSEEEQVTRKKKAKKMTMRDRRENVFGQRDDDVPLVAKRARVLTTIVKVSSTRGNKRIEFVNRDFNAAINIMRCTVLETRPEELRRSKLVGQPLRLVPCMNKPKSIAGSRSNRAGTRLRVGIHAPCLLVGLCFFH